MSNAKLIDISRYQVVNDWHAVGNAVSGVVNRATVGNYYTDTSFDSHWNGAGSVGKIRSCYHVVAPADTLGIRISAKVQMDRFFTVMQGKKTDIPVVLDCELSRNQTKDYITQVIAECIQLALNEYGKYPIIYTRKTWFDYYTNPHPLFGKCDLWPARYSTTLVSPWSDGYYKFRDWTTWKLWQWSSTGTTPGIVGAVDQNWFNGDLSDLMDYANQRTLLQRVEVLEREALARGWNLDL